MVAAETAAGASMAQPHAASGPERSSLCGHQGAQRREQQPRGTNNPPSDPLSPCTCVISITFTRTRGRCLPTTPVFLQTGTVFARFPSWGVVEPDGSPDAAYAEEGALPALAFHSPST